MPSPATIHLLVFGGALVIAVGTLLWTFRNSENIAIEEFRFFLAIVVLWIGTQIVELLAGAVASYYASFSIRGLRGLMAFSWFYFTMTYAGYGEFVHSTRVRVVVGIATGYLTLVTAVPPVATEVIFPSVTTTAEPLVAVSLGGVTPFRRLAQFIGYSLVLIGTTGLTHRFLTTGYTKWWRPVALLVATLLVASLDFVSSKSGSFLLGVDYAALGATGASVMLIGILYRHDLFASVPIGRDHLFRTLDEPVFVLDSRHRVIDRNDAARTLCTKESQIGAKITNVLPGETTVGTVITSTTDEQSIVEIQLDNTVRYYKQTVSEIATVGESQRAVMILREVTEQRQRKEELEQQNERLEAFSSVVSHDLQNPLNVANGRLELAMQESNSEHLEGVADAHERMETMIDELLRLARKGAIIEDLQPVKIAEMSERCWETVETREATLRVETNQRIKADPARLQEVLENLFRNAIEHGGTETTITVGAVPNGFYLADDGPGIPPNERADVFERGYSTSEAGTGLGLHIVQEIIHAHGWQVVVRASESSGPSFEISGVEFAESPRP